jgi:hypothetical protein
VRAKGASTAPGPARILPEVGWLGLTLACAGAALIAGCGLGVDGLQAGVESDTGPDAQAEGGIIVTGGMDATADTALGPDSPAVEAGADAPGIVDVAPPIEAMPADGCVPTGPESCTNGIDDDCNGLTDCQDMACTGAGYTCVPSPQNGWSFVAFDATGRPACPATLTVKALDVDPTDLTSPAVCSCACAIGTEPSCETGNITAKFGMANACNTPITAAAMGGQCVTDPMSQPAPLAGQATGPGLTGGSCTAQVTPTVPSTGASQGETCGGETAFGAGCGAGQVCALAPSPFAACVHHGGQQPCAVDSGYSKAHTVGTLQDSRGCSACTCATTPTATCGPATWNFYATSNCMGTPMSLTANGVCNTITPTAANAMVMSAMFTSTPENVSCGQPNAMPAATGNVTLTGADSICCE